MSSVLYITKRDEKNIADSYPLPFTLNMKRVYKRGEIAKIILLGLAGTAAVVVVLALPGVAPAMSLFIPKNEYERRRIKASVKKLENKNLIQSRMQNGKLTVSLTGQGRKELARLKYQDLFIKQPTNWDGMWRVVMFDIPESKRSTRSALRIKLQDLGFCKIQKSVFIFPYPCKNEIDLIRDYFRVKNGIQYLVVSEVENEERLKKIFKL